MRHFLILLLLVIPACAARPPEPAPAHAFRLATYNVDTAVPSPDLTLRAIRDLNPDVACLQETTPAWEPLIREALGDLYPTIEFRHETARNGGGLALLSKLPVVASAYLPPETTWFGACAYTLRDRVGNRFTVLNVHLHPPVGEAGAATLGGLLFTAPARVAELERFLRQVDASLPLVVAGDFNDETHSAPLRLLYSHGMASALQQFDALATTWHYPSMPALRRRLDHIVFGPPFHCHDARAPQVGGSDHYPVIATLSLPAASSAASRERIP